MKVDDEKELFSDSAKKMLDDLSENLDSHTLTRLGQSRRLALQSPQRKIPWLVPAVGFAMATALISIFLWQGGSQSNGISLAMEDLDLLARAEPLDFYGDLEFYSWLEEREGAG